MRKVKKFDFQAKNVKFSPKILDIKPNIAQFLPKTPNFKPKIPKFTVLYHVVGNEALDEIICPLLEQLTPEQDHILAGLCDVMRQNSRSMLPYLLPKLTKPPVNVHALCSLASVSGDSLSR